MGHFAANDTMFASEDGDFKPFARSVTILAAACAITFSIIGVLGNVLYPSVVLRNDFKSVTIN